MPTPPCILCGARASGTRLFFEHVPVVVGIRRLEAEISVTGAILNMALALSAALAFAQSSLPGKKLSVSA